MKSTLKQNTSTMVPIPTPGRIQPVIPLPLEKKKTKCETSHSSVNDGYVRPSLTPGSPLLGDPKKRDSGSQNSRSHLSVPTVFPTQSQQPAQSVVNGVRHASIAPDVAFPDRHNSSYIGYIIDKTSMANRGKPLMDGEKQQYFLADGSGQHVESQISRPAKIQGIRGTTKAPRRIAFGSPFPTLSRESAFPIFNWEPNPSTINPYPTFPPPDNPNSSSTHPSHLWSRNPTAARTLLTILSSTNWCWPTLSRLHPQIAQNFLTSHQHRHLLQMLDDLDDSLAPHELPLHRHSNPLRTISPSSTTPSPSPLAPLPYIQAFERSVRFLLDLLGQREIEKLWWEVQGLRGGWGFEEALLGFLVVRARGLVRDGRALCAEMGVLGGLVREWWGVL